MEEVAGGAQVALHFNLSATCLQNASSQKQTLRLNIEAPTKKVIIFNFILRKRSTQIGDPESNWCLFFRDRLIYFN
jgi:hypothetical protein